MDKKLLGILVCPEDHGPLDAAGPDLLARVNRAIAAGRVKNRAGQPVTEPLAAALVRRDGKALYPIRNDIPVLTREEAIPLNQIEP